MVVRNELAALTTKWSSSTRTLMLPADPITSPSATIRRHAA
jgi:hypothetical protein